MPEKYHSSNFNSIEEQQAPVKPSPRDNSEEKEYQMKHAHTTTKAVLQTAMWMNLASNIEIRHKAFQIQKVDIS